MTPPEIDNNTETPSSGVSPTIKIIVISLTVLTVIAFSVLFFKLVGKVTSADKEIPWALQLKIVGDKLNEAELHREAIAQYENFLEHEEIDLKTRASVSQTLGELYVTLGECGSALVWFYQAEVARTDPADKDTLDSNIATCLEEVQSGRP